MMGSQKITRKSRSNNGSKICYYVIDNAPVFTEEIMRYDPDKLISKLNPVVTLKDDKRSYVAIFERYDKSYVLKVPRDKNRRQWIRFTTLYRRSEVKKMFDNLIKIKFMKINTNTPVVCGEKRVNGMVIDSYLIYSYIDGRPIRKAEYPHLIGEIKRLHNQGYLHGDFHSKNFITQDGKIFFLDTTFRKNLLGSLGCAYEMVYFHYNKNTDRSLLLRHEETLTEFSKLVIFIATTYYKWLKSWKYFKRKYFNSSIGFNTYGN